MKLATIIYGGSCESGKRSVIMIIVNEGSIAKPSICIDQWLDADFLMVLLANLGNDDFCSHGPSFFLSLSLFFFLSTYLRALLLTILGILETLFERQTPTTNSIQCVTRTNRIYVYTPDHNYIKLCQMGFACQYIFIKLLYMREKIPFPHSTPTSFIFIINRCD